MSLIIIVCEHDTELSSFRTSVNFMFMWETVSISKAILIYSISIPKQFKHA
jgi:hypothetical protein